MLYNEIHSEKNAKLDKISNDSGVSLQTPSSCESKLEIQRSFISTTPSSVERYTFSEWSLVPNDFSTLPMKVLMKIFQFLNEVELSRSVLRVCRNWRKAGSQPLLWKRLTFTNDSTSSKNICRLLRVCNELKYLKLVNISDVKTVIRQLCRCNKNIEHLHIRYCTTPGTYLPETVLQNIALSCPDLRILDLKGTNFASCRFFQQLASCAKLKSINFGDNAYIQPNNIVTISLNCRSVQELKISRRLYRGKIYSCNICSQDALFVFENFKDRLRVLKLDCVHLQLEAINALLRCENMEYLCLIHANALSNTSFRNLWRYFPRLRVLRIIDTNHLSTTDFHYLFTIGKTTMKNVCIVDITGCWKITDRGLDTIADCCGRNLTKLILTSCMNLEYIKFVITKCPNLRYLNIAFCMKIDLRSIEQIPIHLHQLNKLVIDHIQYKNNPDLFHQIITQTTSHPNVFINNSELSREMVNILDLTTHCIC